MTEPMNTWSPAQYLKFEDERSRPARDLLARVPLEDPSAAVDIGCGPGNSTELLVERFPGAAVTGLDTSPAMLAEARTRLPSARFVEADAADWRPESPVDLIFANAVLQWVPDHLGAIGRLMEALNPGGVLAFQVPDNLDEPSHVAMRETVAPPAVYYDRLRPGAASVEIWHTAYYHPLADAPAIVEWVKGTGLRPYLDRLGEDERTAYLAAYQARIAEAYPPLGDGRVLLKFPRLFVVAVRA